MRSNTNGQLQLYLIGARNALARGDIGAALKMLEQARGRALKLQSLAVLDEIRELAQTAAGHATSRKHARNTQDLLYALEQNRRMVDQFTTSRGIAPPPSAPAAAAAPGTTSTSAPSSTVALSPRRGMPGWEKALLVVAGLVAIGVFAAIASHGHTDTASATTSTSTPTRAPTTTATTEAIVAAIPDRDVDHLTRVFIATTENCRDAVALAIAAVQHTSSLIQQADALTQAHETCADIRDTLGASNTSHFSNEALDVEIGIDDVKAGLGSLLAYLDSSAPTDYVDGKNNLQNGLADITTGLREINQRRTVYNLSPVKLD